MTTRRKIICEIYNEENNRKIVEGRLLGYITGKDFAIITQHSSIQKGIATSGTVPLSDLNKAKQQLVEKRLILEIKKIDGEIEKEKKLFITDVITEVICYTDRNSSGLEYMSFETKHGHWLALTEN